MHPEVRSELPLIEKIHNDEIWLEGERRQQPVDPDDPAVVQRVCEIVIENSLKIREFAVRQIKQN